MDQLWRDVRFGLRMLGRHPTLSIIAILTFGMGIGITTTVFSVVNGAFFKGLPFEDSDRVVAIANTNPSRNIRNMAVSVHDLALWQERQTAFEILGPFFIAPINMSWAGGQPERFSAGLMSTASFNVLAVKPLLGRIFRDGEDRPGAEPVIILGYDVWRDRFGSSANVLGQTVRANGVARTIIGVMPERFEFPGFEKLWIPLEVNSLATKRGSGPSYPVVARLKKGVSIKEAQAQALAIAAQLEKEYPETNRGLVATVRPYAELYIGPRIYRTLYTMLAAGIGVLLVACVNVANLLLARASLRSREVAVRMALGARRSRIIVQFMTEVLILALAGGVLGFLFSSLAMKWFLTAIETTPPPFWITFELDHRVMLFVIAVTIAAGLFAGLIPALKATGKYVGEALKDESRASTGMRMGRFSAGLIIAEVAISCGLLIAAGLMIKSVVQLKTIQMPFATENIFTARVNLPRHQYPDDASCIRFYEQLLPKLASIAGVEAATLSDGLPASGNGTVSLQIEGKAYSRDSDYPIAREGIVTPGYFKTFQTKMVQGREFTALDRPGNQPVAVVNESFARAHFPGLDPLGRHIRKGRADSKAPWLTIVGVVPDMLMQGIGNSDQSGAGYYLPIAQSDVTNFVSIALRTQGEPARVAPEVRGAVTSMDKDLAIYDVLPMKEVIARRTWFYTVFGTFFMAFGCVALLLAVAGLYGVMSFSVTQRIREIGIRVALGAQDGQLLYLIMKKGVIRIVLGLLFGLGIGLLASNLLQGVLFQVNTRDPMVVAVVLLALAAAGLLASFIPAYRVTRVDPVVALATE